MSNTTFSGPVRSENGFQTVAKNTTTGKVTVTAAIGNTIQGGVQRLTGSGAVDTTNLVTVLDANTNAAFTLGVGVTPGTLKIVANTRNYAPGNAGILEIGVGLSATNIVFDAIGQSVTLLWTSVGWALIAVAGATVI